MYIHICTYVYVYLKNGTASPRRLAPGMERPGPGGFQGSLLGASITWGPLLGNPYGKDHSLLFWGPLFLEPPYIYIYTYLHTYIYICIYVCI